MLICVCGSALAQDVKYDFVQGTDFSKYKTYKWVEIPGGAHPDQMMADKIRQAIDSELTKKGLSKTDSDRADLFVGYQIAVDQEKEWNAMGYGGARFNRMGTATSSTINVGNLVFDIYDAATKKQVWKGEATQILDPSKDPPKINRD